MAILEDLILFQMTKWVDQGVMFTAFDVTKALRNDGCHVNHADVKRVVRTLWDNKYDDEFASYERTSIDFGAVAYVFHPYGKDPENYDPDWLAANYAGYISPPYDPATLTTITQNPPTKSNTSTSSKVSKLTSEGRLNVPLKMVRQIGINDKYWVSNTLNGEILVTNADPTTDDEISDGIDKTKCYTFFREIRISPIILSRLSSKKDYNIEVDKDHIVIT